MFLNVLASFVMDKTIPQGAATTLWACLAPEVELDENRGSYLMDCAKGVPSTTANNEQLCNDFWVETYKQLNEATANL